jgi:hypothetical protein
MPAQIDIHAVVVQVDISLTLQEIIVINVLKTVQHALDL